MSEQITATVHEFGRMSGLSRRTLYELINAGELESIKIGARRLIVVASFHELIQRAKTVGSDGGKRRGRKPKLLYLQDLSP